MINIEAYLPSAALIIEQHLEEFLALLFVSIAAYSLGISRVRSRMKNSEKSLLAYNIFQVHFGLMGNLKEAEHFRLATKNPISSARSELEQILLFMPDGIRKSKTEKKLKKYLSDMENLETYYFSAESENEDFAISYCNAASSVSELLSSLNSENSSIWKKIPLQAQSDTSRVLTSMSLGRLSNVSSH